MSWDESLFVKNAKLFAMTLESLWENGEQSAKLIADFLGEKGMKRARVLDIPCGIGRISVPLARLGHSVTGVDMSPYLIRVAKRKARQFKVSRRTSFVAGRMKEVDTLFRRDSFDVAINVFTSIGYGTERDDQRFFHGLRRVVKQGGLFIIAALANRDYLVSHFMQNLYTETERLVVLERNELDQAHSRLRSSWKFYVKAGKSLKFAAETPLDLRLYSPHEVVAMLEGSGWKSSAIYDSLTYRKPVSSDNHSFAIVAEAA
jgi:ubiquinone/menaquinone biosynthesis C-methylase UbiE